MDKIKLENIPSIANKAAGHTKLFMSYIVQSLFDLLLRLTKIQNNKK